MATNPESKKYDVDKRMWTTNYRETENPTIRQKWISEPNTKPSEPKASVTVANASVAKASTKVTMQLFAIFIFAWTMIGILAFIWSLYCFNKSGSIQQKVLGLLFAIFIGPLFFIYYKYSPSYCK